MVDVSLSGFAPAPARAARRVALSGRSFWALFAVEAIVIVVLLAAVVYALPSLTPLAATTDRVQVRDAVLDRLSGAVADDLVQVAPGQAARASNLRGLRLNGQTYYYYLEAERGFDPLSRGTVNREQVAVVLRDTSGPTPLVIYTLK